VKPSFDGGLVIDKPTGISSAVAVEHVKRTLGADRAGHGGTLDPIATGVLPICLGAATKLAQYLLADDKGYEADLVLGVETDTLDRTGTVVARADPGGVTRDAVVAALAARTGEQDQVPPMFSAIKQGGVRLYHRARAGEEVERTPRRIRIDRLELVALDLPRVRIAIACSKGTYVRSLVADLGRDLGVGAHMTELRRTRSGRFAIEHAIPLDAVGSIDLAAHLIALPKLTSLDTVAVPPHVVRQIRDGIQLPLASLGLDERPDFQLVDDAGELVAIARGERGKLVYQRVFVGTLSRSSRSRRADR
jgi:tRNA pseudouridine55 synthase